MDNTLFAIARYDYSLLSPVITVASNDCYKLGSIAVII